MMLPKGEVFTREEWRRAFGGTTTEELQILAREDDGLTLGCEDEILVELQERVYLEVHAMTKEAGWRQYPQATSF